MWVRGNVSEVYECSIDVLPTAASPVTTTLTVGIPPAGPDAEAGPLPVPAVEASAPPLSEPADAIARPFRGANRRGL